MQGSFLDFIPPEAHAYVGAAALLMAVFGLIIWSSGFKVARFCVSMLCGLALATLAAILVPKFLFVSPLSCALVGFAIGAVAGALGFRLLQGLTLALCLGTAVSAVYYHWHITPDTTTAPTAQTLPAAAILAADATKVAADLATAFVKNLNDRWSAIPLLHQKRLMVAGIGTASIILLIAFGFARHTTLIVSALIGSIMIAAGTQALVQTYAPAYLHIFQVAPLWRYLTLGMMTLLGIAIQHHFHWPRKPKPPAAEPVPAVPVSGQ